MSKHGNNTILMVGIIKVVFVVSERQIKYLNRLSNVFVNNILIENGQNKEKMYLNTVFLPILA